MDKSLMAFDCPHCGAGYTIEAGEALFIDDVGAETASQCEECQGWYQLRCVSVEMEMEAVAAVKTGEER